MKKMRGDLTLHLQFIPPWLSMITKMMNMYVHVDNFKNVHYNGDDDVSEVDMRSFHPLLENLSAICGNFVWNSEKVWIDSFL